MCTYEGGHEYNVEFTKRMGEFFQEVGGRR
jgi:hypothetical protein